MHYVLEALVVGIIVIFIGNLSVYLVGKSFSVELPEICDTWNKYYTMEVSLFVTGFLTHVICELSGINKWYCGNGYACR